MEKKENYLVYAILFVTILILTGITITYAFLQVETTTSTTTGGVNASMDCIDISYAETGTYTEDSTINLNYNYPISDDYALANVIPITVKVTNNCTANTSDINYTLAITSLSNADGYISDDKIRVHAKRQLANNAETALVETNYLNSLTSLTSGNAYTYLTQDLDTRTYVSSYTNRSSYIIDSSTIANGITNIYKVYLWVDYYEGDTTHTGLNDNSTEGKKFTSAISLVVNP